MNEDDAKVALNNLMKLGQILSGIGFRKSIEVIAEAVGEFERLTAEVERLTPKPLDCFQICDIFNAHAFGGRSDWVLISEGDEPFRIGSGSGFGYFKDDAAVYIAQGLLRDAGPSDAKGTKE